MIRIQVELTDSRFNELWNEAARSGFRRVDPRKSWTEKEKKEAIRWLLTAAIVKLP